MKKTLISRIVGYVFLVTAVLGILFCVYAIINVWRAIDPITENLTSSLDLVDNTLSATADALSLAEEALINATIDVTALENTVKSISRAVGDTTLIVDSLITLSDEDLPNTIVSVQTALDSVQSSAMLIENALTTITSIPFIPGDPYDPEVTIEEAFGQASASLEPLHESMSTIKDSLKTSRGNIILTQAELNITARHIGELNTTLNSARAIVSQYQDVVSNLHDRLDRWEAKLPTWINISAWSLTLLLVWLSIIQVGLLMQGLDFITKESA